VRLETANKEKRERVAYEDEKEPNTDSRKRINNKLLINRNNLSK
jgi:hypothetical protein